MFPARFRARRVFSTIDTLGAVMKDPVEVLRRKEAELEQLQEEVYALRLAGRLLKERPPKDEEQSRGKVLQMP